MRTLLGTLLGTLMGSGYIILLRTFWERSGNKVLLRTLGEQYWAHYWEQLWERLERTNESANGNALGTLWEHCPLRALLGTFFWERFWERSGNVLGTFWERSGNV